MKRTRCSCRGGLYVHPLARQGEIHQKEGQSEGRSQGALLCLREDRLAVSLQLEIIVEHKKGEAYDEECY